MPEVPEEVFLGGLHKLLEIEKDWVKKGKGNTLYIRPFNRLLPDTVLSLRHPINIVFASYFLLPELTTPEK